VVEHHELQAGSNAMGARLKPSVRPRAAIREVRSLVAAIALASTAATAQVGPPYPVTPPVCEDRFVEFTPPSQEFLDRIIIEWSPGARAIVNPATRRKPEKSPQQTRWFVLQEPNFFFGGPWNSVLTVFTNPDAAAILRVTLLNHGRDGARPKWINEKLLYLDVGWGRIRGTDLILDLEARKTIYIEDADFGEFSGPCEHKPNAE
jgi:hypothetical protein